MPPTRLPLTDTHAPYIGRRAALTLGALAALTACSQDSNDAKKTSASAAATARTTFAPAHARVAFIGDSFSVGMAASSMEKRWTTLVANHFGWQEDNVAVSGRGYIVGGEDDTDYINQYRQALTSKPAAFIVSGGWNDVAHNHSVSAITDAARGLLKAAQTHHSRILVIAPLAPSSGPPEKLSELSTSLKQLTSELHVPYMDLGMPATGHPEWTSADGLHPSDTGYAKLSELVIRRLAALR